MTGEGGRQGRALPRNKHTETRNSQGMLKEYKFICSRRNTKSEKNKTRNLSKGLELWVWSPSLTATAIKMVNIH